MAISKILFFLIFCVVTSVMIQCAPIVAVQNNFGANLNETLVNTELGPLSVDSQIDPVVVDVGTSPDVNDKVLGPVSVDGQISPAVVDPNISPVIVDAGKSPSVNNSELGPVVTDAETDVSILVYPATTVNKELLQPVVDPKIKVIIDSNTSTSSIVVELADMLCDICLQIPDYDCIGRYCSNGQATTGSVKPTTEDLPQMKCDTCKILKDQKCKNKHCSQLPSSNQLIKQLLPAGAAAASASQSAD